jgi:DNA gyrase/topoisomerase IV subunit B
MYEAAQMHVSASICWYDTDDMDIRSYCNSSYTRENGYHVNALKLALANAIKVDGKSDIDVRFLMYGMRAALQVKMQDPVYEGQTKNKLMSPEIVKPVRDVIEPALIEFFTRNKSLVRTLLDRAQRFQSNFSRMTEDNKAIKSVKLVPRDSRVDLPVKMKAAKPWVKPEDRELIIVEGDSAGSTAKPASFDWQEILPIRGKILNTGKASLAKTLGNQEVKDIITALGTNLGSKCDPSKGRVGRICILTDADDDGYHIASLLSALFVLYFTPWVEQGRVFFINAPLYLGSHKEHKFFGDTPEAVYAQFPSALRSKVLLTRAKGWGELRPDQLRTIAMDPSRRRLIRLTVEADDFLEIDRMMGNDTKYRKTLLGIEADSDEGKD